MSRRSTGWAAATGVGLGLAVVAVAAARRARTSNGTTAQTGQPGTPPVVDLTDRENAAPQPIEATDPPPSRHFNRTMRRVAATIAVTAVAAGVGAVSASFGATTTNPGNQVSTGSVALSDNDGGSLSMYTADDGNLPPGQSITKCISVTYTGTLTSRVKLYLAALPTSASEFDLVVESGSGLSGAFPQCTGFVPAGSPTRFSGQLSTFPVTSASGVDGKPSAGTWATNDRVDYRFTLTPRDNTTPGARTAVTAMSAHTFTWLATNV